MKFKINNLSDFDRENPGLVNEIREWFRMIKTYDGKPKNEYGYEGKVLSAEKTLHIIKETSESY